MIRRLLARRRRRGSYVVGDVTLPAGYEPPSGLLTPASTVDEPAPDLTPERLDEIDRAARRAFLARTAVSPAPQPLGTAVAPIDMSQVEFEALTERYAGGRLSDLTGRTVSITVPAETVHPELVALLESLDPAVALAELAPCCGTLLQAVTDTGVAECRCRRRRVHVTRATP